VLVKYKPPLELKKQVSGCDISNAVDGRQSVPNLAAAQLLDIAPVSTEPNQCHNDADTKCTSARSQKGCGTLVCYRNILIANDYYGTRYLIFCGKKWHWDL